MSTQIVMAQILIETPQGITPEAVRAAGETLRARFGERAGIPPGLRVARSEATTRYTSSSGQIFFPAPGRQFHALEVNLEHPANGSGRAGLDVAAELIPAALTALGAKRAIYGSSGIATAGGRDGFRAHWWSEQAYNQLAAIAEIAASGLSWNAPPGFTPSHAFRLPRVSAD